MSTNCPNWGGAAAPPAPPSRTPMIPNEHLTSGTDEPWSTWRSLNRLRVQKGRCRAMMKMWNLSRDCGERQYYIGRVHTTLFRTGRDRSRPVRAQLPVSTRGQLERSFRILETTSRHGTSGRDRSRSVAPCQIYRVDARVGATDLSANQPLLAHAFLIYFFPF